MKTRISLVNLIVNRFYQYLNSEEYTRLLMMLGDTNSFDCTLNFDSDIVYRGDFYVEKTNNSNYSYKSIEVNGYYLYLKTLYVDISYLYKSSEICSSLFSNCDNKDKINVSNFVNNATYDICILTDKYKKYSESLNLINNSKLQNIYYNQDINIRNYDWSYPILLRYNNHLKKMERLRNINVLDLVSIEGYNLQTEIVKELYEKNEKEVNLYIKISNFYDYDEDEELEKMDSFFESYITALSKSNKSNNKFNLFIILDNRICQYKMTEKRLVILNSLHSLFDKLDIVTNEYYTIKK